MFDSIWKDVKQQFSMGNMITRLVIVNVAVFVLVNIVNIILVIVSGWEPTGAFQKFLHFFCMSSDGWYILKHPWVIITHMFLHEGFFHVLFNMLFLYWFGRIVGDFIGDQRILPLYLLGGLFGAIIYYASYNLLPYGGEGPGYALGASAAVMAIVVSAGTIAPDYIMRLLFLGDVKLKYIAAAMVFLDLIGIANFSNTGGAFAHLGGAFFGWLFIYQLRNGNDLSAPVNNVLNSIFDFFNSLFKEKPRRRPKVAYKSPNIKQKRTASRPERPTRDGSAPTDSSHQERLDAILDKIKDSGYDSLSMEDKEFLFNASKK